MDREERDRLFTLLSAGRWFGGLSEELRHLILSRSHLRHYGKGQIVSQEGNPPPGLFAVIDGRVQVVKHTRTGDEVLIYVGERGFWSGDYAVLMGTPSLVSSIARVKTKILVLPKREFERIVTEEPRHTRDFARLAIGRTASYISAFAMLTSQAPETRLRGQLALLVHMKQDESYAPGPVELALSQADLAAIIGVSRQTINPMLGRLEDDGVIETGFRRIRVVEPRALQFDGVPAGRSMRRRRSGTADAPRPIPLEKQAA